MTDIEHAKVDPASVYKHPSDIVEDVSLTFEERVDILQRWAYDEREKSVAEEENMLGTHNSHSLLEEIMKCLLEMGVESSKDGHAPTKQG